MSVRWPLMPNPPHRAYWHDVLGEEFCEADGEPWPCLFYRQSRPPKCLCTHPLHPNGQCWHKPCGCQVSRPQEKTT